MLQLCFACRSVAFCYIHKIFAYRSHTKDRITLTEKYRVSPSKKSDSRRLLYVIGMRTFMSITLVAVRIRSVKKERKTLTYQIIPIIQDNRMLGSMVYHSSFADFQSGIEISKHQDCLASLRALL